MRQWREAERTRQPGPQPGAPNCHRRGQSGKQKVSTRDGHAGSRRGRDEGSVSRGVAPKIVSVTDAIADSMQFTNQIRRNWFDLSCDWNKIMPHSRVVHELLSACGAIVNDCPAIRRVAAGTENEPRGDW
jgi:hypothetical protein